MSLRKYLRLEQYQLSFFSLLKQLLRVIITRALAKLYCSDQQSVTTITKRYCVGNTYFQSSNFIESWKAVEKQFAGIKVLRASTQNRNRYDIPFVYERTNAQYLVEFRDYYHLEDTIKDSDNEYVAMQRLAAWVGTQWDHGTSSVPGGTKVCNPIQVVQSGQRGAKFWCEIAARLMVHAATALGWPARLVTCSRNGYAWEHAVAELWSNVHKKWFVIDPDFNIVYEHNGIPLSAFEICHQGLELDSKGLIRIKSFAPIKPSLRPTNLIPFYKYIHIDMRNDWCTRNIRRGSPTSGDIATWYTTNKHINKILTSAIKIDDENIFNWPVNVVEIHIVKAYQNLHDIILDINLSAYSPYFIDFEISLDLNPWFTNKYGRFSFNISNGIHYIHARTITEYQNKGPISTMCFQVQLN
ncbi:transglutaminase domain-containing protein [Desulforhabdus sp. TSK]|uniref:transglutaminase domain-containing protein n=1 Tax=Desulforhabdus sp. TSK TaxID=2925014 RepID=UPI001FC8BAD1|nr:transglutaminase domain-containing protein [Desulforhabdus sp. TSK]GKT07860.1 hypothetical protein DSTSK_11650 [Desulforhabdus sp. TSK]